MGSGPDGEMTSPGTRRKILFSTDGFPGVEGAGAGSGIGRHLAELTSGLNARGHECHVLTWGQAGAPTPQVVDGVRVHLTSRGYWPLFERLIPGSRDVATRRVAARRLVAEYDFDWIEIQSDEGIDIGIQRDFPGRCILRVHTTLAQMVHYKEVIPTRATRAYLARERKSLQMALRLIVSTSRHAAELQRLFHLRIQPRVLPLGFDPPRGVESGQGEEPRQVSPTFLIVGSLDRRKGSDRLRGALDAYVRRYGPCRCVVVTSTAPGGRAEFNLGSAPACVEIVWLSALPDEQLYAEYARASALLHLARYESFGYPPVEAAALGTPVVATATGVAHDLLEGDLIRFLVDGDDPEEIATALSEAVRSPTLGPELRARHARRFSRDATVSNYLATLGGWERNSRPGEEWDEKS